MKLPYRVSSIKVYLWLYLPSNDNSDKIRYLHGGRSHFGQTGQLMPFMFLFFKSIISVIRLNGWVFFWGLVFQLIQVFVCCCCFVLNLYGCDANIFSCCSEWKIKMSVLNDSDFILPSEYIPFYPITKNDKTVAYKLFSTTFTFDLHMAVYHLSFACLILPGSRSRGSDVAAPGANWVSFCAPICFCCSVGGNSTGFNQIHFLCWLSKFLEDSLEVS